MKSILCLCYILLLVSLIKARAPTLGSYNVDKNKLSISGLSSGGFFAVQFHVAFSKIIMGAGVVAGGPYYCAEGILSNALTRCMNLPAGLEPGMFVSKAHDFASQGKIDDPSNLNHSKVYIFSGIKDTVVNPVVVKVLEKFYDTFIDKSNIETEYNIPAEHSIVTDDFGNQCGILSSPYINNCGYCTAYHILQHIYGDIKPANKNNIVESNLMEFSQSEFFSSYSSMDSIGYIYVPTACHNNGTMCQLHIAFHGCKQGREFIDTTFALHAEYDGIAEVNNIIVVYPQIHKSLLTNPNGCWDWWGYTAADYAVKNGIQMAGVRKILSRVAGV